MKPLILCFAHLTEDNIREILVEKDSKKTQNAIRTPISILRAFCDETEGEFDFERATKQELNEILISFYANARKKVSRGLFLTYDIFPITLSL